MLKIIVESVTYFLNLGANVYPIVTKCLHINFGAGIATVLVKRIHFNISTTHMFWLSRSEAGSKAFDLVYKSASTHNYLSSIGGQPISHLDRG